MSASTRVAATTAHVTKGTSLKVAMSVKVNERILMMSPNPYISVLILQFTLLSCKQIMFFLKQREFAFQERQWIDKLTDTLL